MYVHNLLSSPPLPSPPLHCLQSPDSGLVGAVRLPNIAIAVWRDGVRGNVSSRELRQVLARSAPGSIESLEVLMNGTAVVRLKDGAMDEVFEGKVIMPSYAVPTVLGHTNCVCVRAGRRAYVIIVPCIPQHVGKHCFMNDSISLPL